MVAGHGPERRGQEGGGLVLHFQADVDGIVGQAPGNLQQSGFYSYNAGLVLGWSVFFN
jgi:hypothetical protein